MKKFVVKKAGKKGKGLFTTAPLWENECIFSVDLSDLQPPRPGTKLSKEEWNHLDYAGRGKYVISAHPYVYINHSCDPNVYIKHETIARSSFFALRGIQRGEELTYDYGVSAMDQFEDLDSVLDCKCGARNCRGRVHTNFFKQPLSIQKKYYEFLPPSIKRRYRAKFEKLNR